MVARENVVDQWNRGGPHEHEDALDVELHAEEVNCLAMRHESVEAHGEEEANRNANEVSGADEQVGGCRDLVAQREGEGQRYGEVQVQVRVNDEVEEEDTPRQGKE